MTVPPQMIFTPTISLNAYRFTSRAFEAGSDLQAIADLINTCHKADQIERYTSIASLEADFKHPNLDLARDVRVWEDGDRQIVAFAGLWMAAETHDPLEGDLWFQLHPRVRHAGVPAQLLTWAEARMRQIGSDRGVAVNLRGSSRESQIDRIRFFEANGFKADRWFHTMGRSLVNSPLAQPQMPDGFTVRPVQALKEAEAWVEMFNQSFIDHWNHHDLTLEDYYHEVEQDPEYKPELDLVAIAPDGTLAGFCVAAIDTADNQQRHCREGWINLLGTRRGFRLMGLGRALLLQGLQCLQQHGMDYAKIGVDSQNPNQAFALYESAGFRHLYTCPTFIKPLDS
ncbi:MAG: GNAT family N-acetyltransferase [Elainellaceae cyanobacterium]